MTRAKPDADATPVRPNSKPGSSRFRVRHLFRDTTRFNEWVAWGVLTIGLIVIVLTSLHVKSAAESAAQREYDVACNEIRIYIDDQLEAAAQLLRSGAALFDAAETVSRESWRIV